MLNPKIRSRAKVRLTTTRSNPKSKRRNLRTKLTMIKLLARELMSRMRPMMKSLRVNLRMLQPKSLPLRTMTLKLQALGKKKSKKRMIVRKNKAWCKSPTKKIKRRTKSSL